MPIIPEIQLLVKNNLLRLSTELAYLRCVSATIFIMNAEKLSGVLTRMSLLSPQDHPTG